MLVHFIGKFLKLVTKDDQPLSFLWPRALKLNEEYFTGSSQRKTRKRVRTSCSTEMPFTYLMKAWLHSPRSERQISHIPKSTTRVLVNNS